MKGVVKNKSWTARRFWSPLPETWNDAGEGGVGGPVMLKRDGTVACCRLCVVGGTKDGGQRGTAESWGSGWKVYPATTSRRCCALKVIELRRLGKQVVGGRWRVVEAHVRSPRS